MADHRVAVIGREIGHQIVTALGLTELGVHSTRRITIDIGTEAAVTVHVEYYPTAAEMGAVEGVLQAYEIVPRTFQEPEEERARCEYAIRILESYGFAIRGVVALQSFGIDTAREPHADVSDHGDTE